MRPSTASEALRDKSLVPVEVVTTTYVLGHRHFCLVLSYTVLVLKSRLILFNCNIHKAYIQTTSHDLDCKQIMNYKLIFF